MRKFLLASVATLGTGGLMGGAAFAQAPAGTPTQGQVAYPMASPLASANSNNNYQAPALPGALANPTPGTIVVHVNGKVQTTFQSEWTNGDTHQIIGTSPVPSSIAGNTTVAPAGSPGGPPLTITVPAGGFAAGTTITVPTTPLATSLGTNGIGVVKLNPYALDSFMRLYFGADAMATNGLRYGAAIELRENFTGQISSNTSTNASANTSLSTVYVRRAFTYVAGEQWGLVRFGEADGVIGIFDNGVTTGQFLINGFGGGDNQNTPGGIAAIPFFFLSTQGAEYANAKLVYLSPQIAGFDFGVQWAPNTSNGYNLNATAGGIFTSFNGSGIGTGGCGPANSECPTLSSGPGIQDGSRAQNQTVRGRPLPGRLRTCGRVGLCRLGAQRRGQLHWFDHACHPGHHQRAGQQVQRQLRPPQLRQRRRRTHPGRLDIECECHRWPTEWHGRAQAETRRGKVGRDRRLKIYVSGPLTVGATVEKAWLQGAVQLTGVTQRREQGIAAGANYVVAPGSTVFGEYMYKRKSIRVPTTW